MSIENRAFKPGPTVSQNLAVTAGAASIVLNNLNRAKSSRTVRIANNGSNPVFLSFVTTATTTQGMCMLGNTVEVFTLPQECTAVSLIAIATGSTVYVTEGEGQ